MGGNYVGRLTLRRRRAYNDGVLKQLGKMVTPRPVWAALSRARVIAERRAMWTAMERDLRGATAQDADVLAAIIEQGRGAIEDDLERWQTPVTDEELTVRQGDALFHARARSDDLYSLWGARENAITTYLSRALKAGDVFVDAGANIGFFTVMAAKAVGPGGRVYAIEMMPETADALRRNIALNALSNVTVVERALSDVAGRMVEAAVPDALWGQASIVRTHTGASCTVETTTLDQVLAGEARVRLMKMDVEGAEALAIRGGEGALRKTQALVFERQRDAAADAAIERQLAALGMTVRALDAANGVATR